jgi:hypothetical protein
MTITYELLLQKANGSSKVSKARCQPYRGRSSLTEDLVALKLLIKFTLRRIFKYQVDTALK